MRILTVESVFPLVIVTGVPKLNAVSNVRPSIFFFFNCWYGDFVDEEIQCNVMFMSIWCEQSCRGFLGV